MRWLSNLALGLVFLCATHADAWAEKRVALVIGNGMYANAPNLPNPRHDAEDVAAALKRLKFDVIQAIDLDHSGMQDAVIRFAHAAQSADVGIFYYSGHAFQFNGVNYLMPVDAKLDGEADLYRFTKVDDVLSYLQKAKALKVLVLDSCRDNPLAETLKRSIGSTRAASIQRGLARIEAPIGTIISYSTQAGRTAVDGRGRLSPYTAAFLKHIEEPNEIGDIFRVISADVYHVTGETQLPELSLSIIGKFYLKGPTSLTVNLRPPAPADPCVAAGDHWKSAEAIGSLAAFEDHLARFPACAFAGLAKARIDALETKVAVVAPPALSTTPPRTEQAAPAAVSRPTTPDSLCSGIPMTSASLSSRPRARPFGSLNVSEECMLKPGDSFKECLDCPEMVVVPAGSFAMGFDPNDPNESHQVTLARPFAVGRFHVTVAQFAYFVSETGYQAGSCFQSGRDSSWRNPGFSQSDNNPVVCVSLEDATAYLAWLSKRTREPYRLLTEAEWEYAARAGSTTRYFWGDDNGGDGQAHAQCQGCNSGAPSPSGTVPVGSFKPNMFGLYDMAGNAQQLVQDCDHADGYRGAPTDGSAWNSGSCKRRAVRGGSWLSQSYDVGSHDRRFHPPEMRSFDTGFRVARTLISR